MSKNFQNVKFSSIEHFLDSLPEDELKIVELLRKEIYACIPNVSEKLSFNVPFFKRHKTICFIWPGSVWWGSKQSINGVQFGFTQGHRLTNMDNHFNQGQRKQVIIKTYAHIRDINIELVRAFLYEAAILDEKK